VKEAPENGKESSHSADAKGMNELMGRCNCINLSAFETFRTIGPVTLHRNHPDVLPWYISVLDLKPGIIVIVDGSAFQR